jgi:hypothetical protein
MTVSYTPQMLARRQWFPGRPNRPTHSKIRPLGLNKVWIRLFAENHKHKFTDDHLSYLYRKETGATNKYAYDVRHYRREYNGGRLWGQACIPAKKSVAYDEDGDAISNDPVTQSKIMDIVKQVGIV